MKGRRFVLAVSLHGATDAERQALVPPAKRWPLAELIDTCRYYTEKRNRRIFFEWTLIEGKNDTPEQAHALGQLLQTVDSHVNLIPLNPTVGYDGLHRRGIRPFKNFSKYSNITTSPAPCAKDGELTLPQDVGS